jgi:hypothetical protein
MGPPSAEEEGLRGSAKQKIVTTEQRITFPVLTLEGSGPGIVIHIVLHALVSGTGLPAQGEWQLVGHRLPGILPLRGLALVIYKVDTAIRKHALL